MLSRRRVLVGTAFLLASSQARVTSTASSDAPVIDPEVRAAVPRGPTRVVVDLRLPAPSASDTGSSVPRTAAITAARDAVLARLTGTTYRLVRRYQTVPLLALEIGPEALGALEAMGDIVIRVRVDRAIPPATPR